RQEIERNGIPETGASGVLGARQKAGFRGMVSPNIRMANTRKDCEMLSQIPQHLQILAQLIIATCATRKEGWSVQSKVRADADHPLGRRSVCSTRDRLQPGKCQQGGTDL